MTRLAAGVDAIVHMVGALGAIRKDGEAKQFQERGLDPAPSTAAELGQLMKTEVTGYAKLTRDAGSSRTEPWVSMRAG